MTPLAAYVLLFAAVGIGFILVHLVAGSFIRPNKPGTEKGTIYECGEPTIGSAWIQFDLRFYVVALLFVIFDVEVAFFFPWAEVFGKANAIANLPEPKSVADYNEAGKTILDLATPVDTPSAKISYERWKRLASLTQEEVDAYKGLPDAQKLMLRTAGKETNEAITRLTPELHNKIKQFHGDLRSTLDAQAIESGKLLSRIEAAARAKDPKGGVISLPPAKGKAKGPIPTINVPERIAAEKKQDAEAMVGSSLVVLAAGGAPVLSFARPGNPISALLAATRQLDPGLAKEVQDTATRQNGVLRKKAQAFLGEMRTEGPTQMALWNNASLSLMQRLAELTPEDLASINKLQGGVIGALTDPGLRQARDQARGIAWLALIEILVFFAVLLVGFAYLWRRGDLAWVRSTLAERGESAAAAMSGTAPLPLVGGAQKLQTPVS